MTEGAPHPPPLELDAPLRDRLLDVAEADFDAADALEARAEEDAALAGELDDLLADPARPLIAALAAWADRPAEGEALVEITIANLEELLEIVADVGWPGLTRVGPMGADAAWIVAQHADAANDRRRAVVDPLREAVAAGEADPRHYATLVDRIAAVDGAPQRFGTIVLADGGEAIFPVPIDDPDELDARRAALGLPPVADELPYLSDGDLLPFGEDRRRSPLLAWPTVLEGHRSIEAVLESGTRQVHALLATRPGDPRLRRLRALARERGVALRAAGTSLIEALASGSTHGGVVAVVGPRAYLSLDELLERMTSAPLLVMLDGVEDPFTFGQAVRALYAAGVDGLIVPGRVWESAAAIVARASAGTSEQLPTARAIGPEEAADRCREAGLRVLCAATTPEAAAVDEVDLSGGCLVVIGGERRGITRSFLVGCDVQIAIPYGRPEAPTLGAAAAAAVIAFEARRQRA